MEVLKRLARMMERNSSLNLYDHTRLARSLSWRYPSHRFAFIASAFAGSLSFIIGFVSDDRMDVVEAFLVGIGVFLAWACARELDPDRNLTAGLLSCRFRSQYGDAPACSW